MLYTYGIVIVANRLSSPLLPLQLVAKLNPLLSGERLGALNGRADSAVNDELGKDTNGAGNTKEDGVVAGLGQAVVLEENTRVGIDVGEGVLGLAVLSQDTRGNLVNLADKLEHGVLGHVGESELALRHVAGIGLAEHSVAVAGNDTAAVEGVPEVLGDVGIAEIVADNLLHLGEPVENLLVSKAVERASKTVETSGEGEEGGAESAANKVSGVGRDVATLVVSVDGEVKTHQLNKVLVAAEAKLVGKVEGVILVLLDSSNLAALEDVLVDAGSNVGELGNEVHGVLKGVAPVLLLVDTLGVGLGEGRGVLKSSDGQRELGHGVKVGRAVVNELLDKLGDVGAGSPLSGEIANLLLGGNLASQEKPEEACQGMLATVTQQIARRGEDTLFILTFGERLLATGGLGEKLLALGDGLATETDTLLGVEDGTLPDKSLDATGTTVDLVKSDLVNNFGSVLPIVKKRTNMLDARFVLSNWASGEKSCVLAESFDLLNLLGEELGEALLESLRQENNDQFRELVVYSTSMDQPGSWRSSIAASCSQQSC